MHKNLRAELTNLTFLLYTFLSLQTPYSLLKTIVVSKMHKNLRAELTNLTFLLYKFLFLQTPYPLLKTIVVSSYSYEAIIMGRISTN
jgi:hypothetical protein